MPGLAVTPTVIDRYRIYEEIGAGGMATVHYGRLMGSAGFARTVAIKKLRPQFAADPAFVRMFVDEARLAVRVRHPNVVPTLDVVSTGNELILVVDYVAGETLASLIGVATEHNRQIPPSIAALIMAGVLQGLHAAHEATDEHGQPLNMVHRDVSPKNIIVGVDGIARVFDFGVAKASVRFQSTRDGQLKGTLPYMAPERFKGAEVTRLVDIYAAGLVLWKALTLRPLFMADSEAEVLSKILTESVEPPSTYANGISRELDEITVRAVAHDPADRFQTAREMALALEGCASQLRQADLGDWVRKMGGERLESRIARVAELENSLIAYPVPETPGPVEIGNPPPSDPPTFRNPHIHECPTVRPKPPPEPDTGSRLRDRSSSSVSSTNSKAGQQRKGRILVIDDSEVVLNRIRRGLEREGFEVVTTTSTVGNARHILNSDLVLIDFHMPGFNGRAVLESLQNAARARAHRCLFFLCTSDKSVAIRYKEMGFDGCIVDKGDAEALARQVQAAFRMMRLREFPTH